MNKFYKTNIVLQWIVAALMILCMMLILNLWFKIIDESILGVLLIFFIVPIIQFLVTPMFTLIGLYKYLSPMLVVFAGNNRIYTLHNGTSFDYLMVMSNQDLGTQFRRKILEYYIDGLLVIIDKIETKNLQPNLVVRGSSYFLSSGTAKRLGFQQSKTSFPEKLNILLNYFDLVWMYSLAHNEFSMPNLKNIKTVSITGKRLLDHKSKLLELKSKF